MPRAANDRVAFPVPAPTSSAVRTRPSGVAQHGVDQLVGVVQPIALIALRDRPEQQPADGVPRRLARLGNHVLMDITASVVVGETSVRSLAPSPGIRVPTG